MYKLAIYSFIAIATSTSFVFLPSPPKSYYHSLFISDSLYDNSSIANHLFILTKRPHVAGSEANAEAAAYVLLILTSYNIKSHVTSYDVALTYPVSRSLILTPSSSEKPIEFGLSQEIYENDPYADVANEVLPTFHAYARSGTANGPVVYANYGRVEDYATLREMGVNVSYTVVLARYGKIYRGDIVHNAYAAGAIGVLIFTDKKDYGGAKWFPDDKWMPPSGVQVGSVYDGTGDPTTPGWPSTGECERLSNEEVDDSGNVPLIPSLPISSADGDAIIRSIGGKEANVDWQGGKDSPIYRVGPGPAIVNLSYEGQQVIRTIQNVIGVIEGEEEPDRFVILGNHRDAWTFGAVDPNSGTAALLEIAQRLEKLQKRGWRPRRTIVLCNWDAEEYGLIGSTEWVEENREMLASRVVAYLNVDCAVQAKNFRASATPQLDELIIQVAQQVKDPDNSTQTIYQSWLGSSNDTTVKLGRLGGAGSDYAAFVQHIGVPTLDLSFGDGYPVYHSMYDDFVWMKKFGDPMFHRHVAVASVWGLLALRLADDEVLPFNYLTYAYELQKSAEQLEAEISENGISLVPLYASIEKLRKAAIKIEDDVKALKAKRSWASVRELNDRLIMTERAFTDKDGLSSRTWYKHLIYAPSRHDDYGSNSFPGISDAIERAKSLDSTDSWRSVQHEVWRVARAITQASLVLSGRLT
ncbi:probable glutamate carboxypeptidase LAMP1 [Nicotiana tomentosiformis]|uniref:probable glutamate carboxypeptidase LAMP1 n=1 Tax=Nicotiana tomentosiformis TaxID=4098 RepID=UPI00051C055B|nr:probable glutamate carboxypeptidase LAMP1 [Nicotiana tomentosiformis]